jgi:3-oxoacyl-[acyl-carrier-protein] synthase-3
MIESGRCRKILFLTADRFTSCTETASSGVRTIFGDGATANLIEVVPDSAPATGGLIGASVVGTDGSGARKLITPTSGARGWVGAEKDDGRPAFEMVGSDVFNFTLREIGPHILDFLGDQGLGVEDIDLFVFHQANLFMLEHLRRRLKISEEQFVVHIAEVGNTVSSTIPLALEECLAQGRVKPGAKVLLCGFGVGFSWGSVLLEYPS